MGDELEIKVREMIIDDESSGPCACQFCTRNLSKVLMGFGENENVHLTLVYDGTAVSDDVLRQFVRNCCSDTRDVRYLAWDNCRPMSDQILSRGTTMFRVPKVEVSQGQFCCVNTAYNMLCSICDEVQEIMFVHPLVCADGLF